MLRSFNYTGRKRIDRDNYTIRLIVSDENALCFDADVDLAALDLPGDAKLHIEAYYQTAWQRFACGSVEMPTPIRGQRLDGFEIDTPVRFRIKAVDESRATGRILAAAQGIKPQSDDDEAQRESLLDVAYRDISPEICRLRWDSGLPVLEVNNQIPGHKHIVKRDPIFHAYVLPNVLREILFRLVVVHEALEYPDGSVEQNWLEFGATLAGERLESYELGEADRVDQWVTLAVERFTRNYGMQENLIKAIRESQTYEN